MKTQSSGSSSLCWSAILTQDASQTYHYLACDVTSKAIQTYLAQATSSSSSTPSSSGGSSKPSLGVIIGAIIGGVVLIILIVVALVLIGKRKRSRSSTASSARPIMDIKRGEGIRVIRPESRDLADLLEQQQQQQQQRNQGHNQNQYQWKHHDRGRYDVPDAKPVELGMSSGSGAGGGARDSGSPKYFIPGTWNSSSTWMSDSAWGSPNPGRTYHQPVELEGLVRGGLIAEMPG